MVTARGVATHGISRLNTRRRAGYTMLFATLAGSLLLRQHIPGGELLPVLLASILLLREPRLPLLWLLLLYLPASVVIALCGDWQQLPQHLIPAWSGCGLTLLCLRQRTATLQRLSEIVWLVPRLLLPLLGGFLAGHLLLLFPTSIATWQNWQAVTELAGGTGLLLISIIPACKCSQAKLYQLFRRDKLRQAIPLFLTALLGITLMLVGLRDPFIYIGCLLGILFIRLPAFQMACLVLLLAVCLYLLWLSQLLPMPIALATVGPTQFWLTGAVTLSVLQWLGLLFEEIRRTSGQLAESEARMRGAIESAWTGFALLDQRGRILEANTTLLQQLGYTLDELRQRTILDITHPDDLAISREQITALLRGEIARYELEKRYLCQDGSILWASVRVSRMTYARHRPFEVILQLDDISERRRHEQALEQQAHRLRLALEAAHSSAWEWNPQTGSSWWDEGIYQILAVAPENLSASQDNWTARIHPDDRERIQQRIREALEFGQSYREIYRIQRFDGATIWVEDYADVERDASGQVLRLYGVSQDVTERTLIEQAISHSENRLRAILDCTMDGIITIDSRGRIHTFNQAAEKMFGYAEVELLGENVSILMPSPHREAHDGYLARYAKMGDPHVVGSRRELMGCHRTGRLFPIEVAVTEVNKDGERFYTGMLRDITRQKASEQALIDARSELQGILNAATEVAMIATNREGRIMLFNTGAERMLGYRSEEIVGQRTPLFIHDMTEVVNRGIELTREYGRPIAGFAVFVTPALQHGHEVREWTYIRKNGSRLTVLLSVTAIRDKEGILTGFLGVAKDISALKQTQQELQTAKEQAEAANRAKSAFLANMSHEIRTPLNAVLGMADLIADTRLDAMQSRYLRMISSAGHSLLSILNDILDFSKIEAGRMELAPTRFYLDDILDNLSGILAVTAAEKHLTLRFGVEETVGPTWFGDGLRLQQILLNLAGNAVKFTRHGSVSLRVENLSEHAAGDANSQWLRFAVQDSGIGIAADQLSRLFMPFSQADTSTTRKFGGTGLGLVISKRLAELMGGYIEVESEPGSGSMFAVVLPLREEKPEPHRQMLRGKNVLILADSAEQQANLSWPARFLGGTLAFGSANQEITPDKTCAVVLYQCPPRAPDAHTKAILATIRRTCPQARMVAVCAMDLQQAWETFLATQSIPVGLLAEPLSASALQAMLQQAVEAGTSQPQAINTAPFTGRHFLLVEDNEVNRIVAQQILEKLGAQVTMAEQGEAALLALQVQPTAFDLVLMDVQMPVMDGYTATRLIREELQLNLPILAMTAGVMRDEQQACLDHGMNAVIAKPIDQKALIETIRHALSTQQTDQDNTGQDDDMTMSPQLEQTAQPGDAHTIPWSLIDEQPDLRQLQQTLGADCRLMRNLLLQFREEIVALPAQLQQAVNDGEQETLYRLLHTLKGQAATFHCPQLSDMAKTLESLARQPEPKAELVVALPVLISSLQALAQSLLVALEQDFADTTDAHLASPAEFCHPEHGVALRNALAEHNLAALDLYPDCRPALASQLPPPALSQLDEAIQQLNFEQARQLLAQYSAELNEPQSSVSQ